MTRRRAWLHFACGVLLAALFLWPAVGFFQRFWFSGSGEQSPVWRLKKTAEQFRPDWLPHRGHLLMPIWPAPDAAHDKGCYDELGRRETVPINAGQYTSQTPRIGDGIHYYMWGRRDEFLNSFELKMIEKNFPLSSGALIGCIEGSLATGFCRRLLGKKMNTEYELARPKLEKQMQEIVNGAEWMACKSIDEKGSLTNPIWPNHPKAE